MAGALGLPAWSGASAAAGLELELANLAYPKGVRLDGHESGSRAGAAVTIEGQAGEDSFLVFHNREVLVLNGGDDDDTFVVRAFALDGSREQEDQRVAATPGELPPGEIIVRIPGTEAPAIGARIRVAAVRAKLHLFSGDGRTRIET